MEALDSLQRLWRRVLYTVGRGVIRLVADAGNVQIVQVRLGQLETRDNTPRLAEYGFTSNPPPGSDAVLLFIAGDRSNGVVVATGHQASRLKGLVPGEAALYDDLGQFVRLTRTGIVISSPLKITLEAPEIDLIASTKIRFAAPTIELHASLSYKWDVEGYGSHVLFGAPSSWTVNEYKTPVLPQTVTTNALDIDTPEVP